MDDSTLITFGARREETNSSGSWSFFTVLNQKGIPKWERGFWKTNDYTYFSSAVSSGNDNIIVAGWNSDQNKTEEGIFILFTFNRKNGAIISTKKIEIPNFSPELESVDLHWNSKNELILSSTNFTTDYVRNGLLFITLDANLQAKKTQFLTSTFGNYSKIRLEKEDNHFRISAYNIKTYLSEVCIVDEEIKQVLFSKSYNLPNGRVFSNFISVENKQKELFGTFDGGGVFALQKFDETYQGNCARLKKWTLQNIVKSNEKALSITTILSKPVYKDANITTKDVDFTIKNVELCIDKIDTTICEGDIFKYNQLEYTKTGVYTVKKNLPNCNDSIEIVLNVVSKIKNIDTTLCFPKNLKIGQNIYTKSGDYQVDLKNILGCDSIIKAKINVIAPIINTLADVTLDIDDTFELTTQSSTNIVKWEWTPKINLNCYDCKNPTTTVYKPITYEVKGFTKENCAAKDSVNIKIKECDKIFIPNVFSPNLDGINDQMNVFSERCVEEIKSYQVFDRWGNLIYQAENFASNSDSFFWNGTYKNQKCNTGVYVLKLRFLYWDGSEKTIIKDFYLN